MLVCARTLISVSQLLYLDICQVCIMLLTGHRFPRNHISLNLFHYASHNLFSHCQKEGFIYPTMIWNLSIITCNCNRWLQNTTHSSWTDLSYLKHHHWQDINRGYFKGICYAGKKKKPTQTNQKRQKQNKTKTSPVYESELLPNLCLFKLILFVLVWKPKTPSEHLNSKKAWLTMLILAIICFFCIKLNFLKITFH